MPLNLSVNPNELSLGDNYMYALLMLPQPRPPRQEPLPPLPEEPIPPLPPLPPSPELSTSQVTSNVLEKLV